MFVNTTSLLLQAGGGNPMFSLLFMVGMIVVMYFFMIRPQAKRAKEEKKFAENLNPGEKIITTAGIHAVITRANDDGTLQIEVSRGSFMIVERTAVSMQLTAAYRKRTETPAVATTK
ncbi:MAG: preprotein translocase subunit YajC [Sphingobacteriales bacterium]|nr:MAG: preprotein translocase subunit YajC [Sphingobacteriales bacterium]